jgi:hypothetical protein
MKHIKLFEDYKNHDTGMIDSTTVPNFITIALSILRTDDGNKVMSSCARYDLPRPDGSRGAMTLQDIKTALGNNRKSAEVCGTFGWRLPNLDEIRKIQDMSESRDFNQVYPYFCSDEGGREYESLDPSEKLDAQLSGRELYVFDLNTGESTRLEDARGAFTTMACVRLVYDTQKKKYDDELRDFVIEPRS